MNTPDRTSEASSAERSHHAESASGLQVKEWCPLFKNSDETNEAAERGTAMHLATEKRDFSGLDEDQSVVVQTVLDYLDGREAELRAKFPDLQVLREEYVEIDSVVWPLMKERSTSAGYLDHAFVYDGGRQIEVNDYKFVKWPVEPAENNLQGIVYLLGLRKRFPQMQRGTARFLMPYLDSIDEHTFEAEQFPELYTRVKRLVDMREKIRALPPEALADVAASLEKPAFTACMWCARIGVCTTLTEIAVRAGSKFAPLRVPENFNPGLIGEKSDISALVQFADVLSAYAKATRERCVEAVLHNPDLQPDSHVLVQQRDREVVDQANFEEGLKFHGLSQEKVDSLKKIGLTAATDALKTLAPKGEKGRFADAVMNQFMQLGVLRYGQESVFLRVKRPSGSD